ncbi:hypothetical protein ACLI09_04560 [Flavobacterium sp. RHBU_24]|uniref:hypothetical protein n=1 Tax=Flavobacterium sp. RHBU_24 TaxID=3391185 RepID=UPI003984FEA7
MTKAETVTFCAAMWTWPDDHLYALADPVIFCDNKYLDKDLICATIFARLTTLKQLEYLAENLSASIFSANIIDWKTELLEDIITNIYKVISLKTTTTWWAGQYSEIVNTLQKEIDRRSSITNQQP